MISDPHKTQEIKVNGKTVTVWIYGDSKNPPIFFIHGYFRGFSDYIGDLPVRHLMIKYQVIAFDLPGFGYSKNLHGDKGEFIETIRKKLLGSKPIGIFATSYGGLVAFEYSYKYSNNVAYLIIAGTPIYEGLNKLLMVGTVIPFFKNKPIIKVLKEFSFLNTANLAKINIPILLFYSGKDRMATVGMGKILEKYLPKAKLITINNRNHKWLLHKINETGLLRNIENFIKNKGS